MEQILTIDGREFHGVTQELSAAQDDFLIGQLRLAGAIDAIVSMQEKPETQAERLLTQLMVSGRAPHVLAGCLTEVGKTWTFEDAVRNAARFAAITSLKDKMAMREAIVHFVAGFFLFAIESGATSRKSSSPN